MLFLMSWTHPLLLMSQDSFVFFLPFFSTDGNNIESDSDIDIQEDGCPMTAPTFTLCLRSKEGLQSKSDLHKSNKYQDRTRERTSHRIPDDSHSVELGSAEKQRDKIKDGVAPITSQSWSSPSSVDGLYQTLDFSDVYNESLIGAPFLFQSEQLSVKPETFSTLGMEPGFSSLSGTSASGKGSLSSQSIASSSPVPFPLAQQMLASQVKDFSSSQVMYWNSTSFLPKTNKLCSKVFQIHGSTSYLAR